MDDADKREATLRTDAAENHAEDNSWYWLTTLYNVPGLRRLFRVKCGR
jgi:hypothetical protein